MSEQDDRKTSMTPRAKELKVLTKGILDIAGLGAIVALSLSQSWDWEVSLGAITTVLGLMRFAPIANKGGPLGYLVAGAAGLATLYKSA